MQKVLFISCKHLLPAVTEHLRQQNRLREWITFFRLISEGQFSVSRLAGQLFLDVIRFNEAKSIHAMRFTDEVKQFWSVGLALFHGKFIRFMGGLKCAGQLTDDSHCTKSELLPDVSKVNCVCPNIKCLKDEMNKFSIDCNKPGIIHSNIETVAKTTRSLASTSGTTTVVEASGCLRRELPAILPSQIYQIRS